MIKLFTLVLVTLTALASAQTNFNYKKDFNSILAKTKDPKDKWNYDQLLSRFKKNDTTLSNADVLALLIGFTAKPDYKPYSDLNIERGVYNLSAEGKYEEGLKKANEFLSTHPLSIKVIFEKAYINFKMGNSDSAKFYVEQGQRIFRAMNYSGDGRSKQTPMFALGPGDGQDYIYKFVGGGLGDMGSGRDDDGNFLDILEVSFKVGEPYALYFIIQHASAKMFEGSELKQEPTLEKKKSTK